MKLFRNILLVASVLILAMVGLTGFTGCSDTNLLESTVGTLFLDFQVSDPGSTAYEAARLEVFNVTVRPVDLEAQQSLGGVDIALLRNEVRTIDLTAGSTILNPSSLPSAAFTISTVNFYPPGTPPIVLEDQNADPLAARCIDRKLMIPETSKEREVVNTAFLALQRSGLLELHPDAPAFLIPVNDTLTHPVTINSSLLIEAYKNAWTCSDNDATCVQRNGLGTTAPCLTDFDALQFLDELDTIDWISF